VKGLVVFEQGQVTRMRDELVLRTFILYVALSYTRVIGDGPLYFAPRSSEEDEIYLRVNGDVPRYFPPRLGGEDVRYLRINSDESLFCTAVK